VQIFHPSMNIISKLSIAIGGAAAAGGLGLLLFVIARSPFVTRQGEAREQPVQFSHEHHVSGLGLDCRYCHTTAETQGFAGIPPVKTCMNCHSQIWTGAPELEPIRAGFREDKSVEWVRVNDLPDYVYFNHSIHVNRGVSCFTCHGPVNKMHAVYPQHTLQMEWCLECHRAPEKFIRPREAVYDAAWEPPAEGQIAMGLKLKEEYKIAHTRNLTSCSTCHR